MILAFALTIGVLLLLTGALLTAANTGTGRHVRPAGTPRARHATPLLHHARTT